MKRKVRPKRNIILSRFKLSNRPKLKRILTIGFFVGLVMANIALLLKQTQLAETIATYQTENKRQQEVFDAKLDELGQFSLLVHLLESVEDEIKRSANQQLSQATIARIVALSQRLAPQNPLVEDSIVSSPARGHLLMSLALMQMDSTTFAQIRKRVSFAGADLRGVDLVGKNLQGIDLRKANLQEAKLMGADLKAANLGGSNLWSANLKGAQLDGADLKRVDFRWANLNQASLPYAQLNGVKLSNAQLHEADLYAASIEWADLSNASFLGANMSCVNFKGSNLSQSLMQGVNLKEAYLGRTDMSESNLTDASLQGANMTGYSPIDLHQVTIRDSLWLQKLIRWEVKGAEIEAQKYVVKINPSQVGSYYLEAQ